MNLGKANRAGMIPALGPVIGIGGQSNANTGGNGTGALSAQTRPGGGAYVKPAGATLYIDGVLQASYPANNFGVEVGFIDEVIHVGGRPAVTVFRYGVNGTTSAAWATTHAATLLGHVSAAGLRMTGFGYIQGEAEAALSLSAAQGWDADLENVLGRLRGNAGGGLGAVLARIRTTDVPNYPHFAAVGLRQDYVNANWPLIGMYNVDDLPLITDGSGTVHYGGATAIESGRRMARTFMAAGIL